MKAAVFFPSNAFMEHSQYHAISKQADSHQQQHDTSTDNSSASFDIKKYHAATIIQSLFRMITAKRKVEKMKRMHPEYVRNTSAGIIQRVFRGFLGRAIVLNMERRKLLKFLRNWSRGKTGNLFHISVLQEMDAQATIYTAISFAMLPSKPARNLPSLKKFRQYRAGLLALYWQVQNRFLMRREEKLKRRSERQRMLYEDLYAHAHESMEKAHLLKEKKMAEMEEVYRRAQEREAAKRLEYHQAQTMLNLQNKQQLRDREGKEVHWRQKEALQKEEEWVKAAVQREYDREWEMMTAEDGWAAKRQQLEKEKESHRITVESEAKKVYQAKLSGWYENKYIESRRMRATLTEVTLSAHVERFEAFLSNQCILFIKSLPFSDEIQLYFQQHFIGNYSKSSQNMVISKLLLQMLEECNFSYRFIQKRLLAMQHMQQGRNSAHKLPLMDVLKYLSIRIYCDSSSRELLCNRAIVNSLSPLQSKGKLLKIDNHHKFFAQEEFLHGVPLQFRILVPVTNVSQFAHLLQYKHIKKLSRKTYRSLVIALAKFKQLHGKLKDIRCEMKESKLLRSIRKEKLALAASYEEKLFILRQNLIDDAMLLYESIYYETRLFLDLFYPSENNYYYRNLNSLADSPSAMQVKSAQFNQQATTSSVTNGQQPPSIEKPMTPGSPHSSSRRKGSILRHSVDGSSTSDNNLRKNGDISESLFQSPDHRNSPHRKKSFSNNSDSNPSNEDRSSTHTPKGNMECPPTPSSPNDASTMKSNRRKGSGMARDSIRRKSMGSTEEKSSNPFASSSAPHLAPGNRTSSKVKLPTRKFNYLIDDPQDYWEDLLGVSGDAYALLPTEIIALLPAPPKPTFNHDGFRHILKVKSILVQQSHYGPNGPIARPSAIKSSGKTQKAAISFGYASNTESTPTSGGKGHIRWAKKRDVFTPMGPQAKERKFFDIPGENAFLEKDIDKYDFFHWAQGVESWTKDVIQKLSNLAQAWKSKHERQLLTFLNAHRLEYLLSLEDNDEDAKISPDQSSHEQAVKNVKLQQFIQSPEVDASDIYDLLLCTYEIAVTAKVNIGRGNIVESSIKISAAELDYVLSRQPFSYLARQSMIQNISDWFVRYFSMYPETLQPSNAHHLREFWDHPLIKFEYSWQKEGLEIFPIIEKEYKELHDIAQVILDNNLLAFDMFSQKLQWHTSYRDQPMDFSNPTIAPSPSRLAALRNKILRKVGITITQTAERYYARFPRFMQPVFRFGVIAPPESFQKQLLREKKAGIAGKYTKIDAKDQVVDKYARKLVQQIFKRCLLKRFLLNCWQAQEIMDYDRQGMMFEDARALLIRKAEKEERQRQREKSCTYRFGRICKSIVVGALLCRPLGPPKVFPDFELNQIDQAHMLLRQMNFARLQRRYLPKLGASIDFQPTPPILTRIMREVICNNYHITSLPNYMELTQREEMFRVIDKAIWVALEQDLADIDTIHITELSHYRLHSWYTGQVVAVNTTTGGHMDMRALLEKELPQMSRLYATLSELPEMLSADKLSPIHEDPDQRNTPPALAASSSSSLIRTIFRSKRDVSNSSSKLSVNARPTNEGGDKNDDVFDEKSLTKALQMSLKKNKLGHSQLSTLATSILDQQDNRPLLKYRQHCPEYWIAGGLYRVMVAMRIVEQEQVNERGVILVEEIDVPSTQVSHLPHIRRTYHHHVPDKAIQPENIPASPLAGQKPFFKRSPSSLDKDALDASKENNENNIASFPSVSTASTSKAPSTSLTKSPSTTNNGVRTSTTTSNRRKGRSSAKSNVDKSNSTSSTGTANSNAFPSSNTAISRNNKSEVTSPTSTTKSNYRRKNALTTSNPLLPAVILQRKEQEEKRTLQQHYALLGTGRGLDGDYSDNCVGLIVRGGFTYHPLCTCCAFSSNERAIVPSGWLAQWGDVFHTYQKRYYCRWHWLRMHARHMYHPQHDSYYQHRQDPRFLQRDLFPLWQGGLVDAQASMWSSSMIMTVSIPEKMREELLRLILHLRYQQLSPQSQDLYHMLVRFQARLRGALCRSKLEKERRTMAKAMIDMIRAQAAAEEAAAMATDFSNNKGNNSNSAGGLLSQALFGGPLGRRLSRLSSRLSQNTGSVRDHSHSVGVTSPPTGMSPMSSMRVTRRKILSSVDNSPSSRK